MIGKNNPLNIRTSAAFKWLGQTGATKGFADFESIDMCRRAGAYLLMRSYRRAHAKSVGGVICRWAPKCENDTASYLHFVCKQTGLKAETVLCFDSDFASILAAMEIFEQGILLAKREEYYLNAKDSYLEIIAKNKLLRYEG